MDAAKNPPSAGGRYTISRHDAPGGVHWDLFLEDGDALRTWRLAAPPESGHPPAGAVPCELLPPHRTTYLDYEGEIGGGRGRVSLHARGTYTLEGDMLSLRDGASEGRYRFVDGGKWLHREDCQERL